MGKQIKYLHTDNGLEFCSDGFNKLCKSEWIVRHLTVRHTPQQNGVAEQMNRMIIEKKYTEVDLVTYALNVAKDIDANQELSNYSEAVSCEDSEKWMFAMQEKIKSLHKNRTWDLVKLPKGKKIVRCKWVFKKKEGTPRVEKLRYKARLVAKGYNQIPRVNFTDVFSPIVKHSSIRSLLGIVAMHDLELEQLDVKTTFLNGELKEDIYMQQPEGFTVSEKEDYVCLLKKSLYGLKQSPRQWYKRFDSFMTSHDFKSNSFDSCVYFKKNCDGSFMYLLLYVDDMLIAAKDKGEIRKVKTQLSEEFEMKDLRLAKKILGMEILRYRKASKLYLCQKGYIEKVLCRFNMQNAKPVSTPLAAHFKLSPILSPQSNDEIKYMSHVPYFSVVGSLVLEELEMESLGMLILTGDVDRKISLTGYVFTIVGCAISWKATLQTTVTLSTTKAEYMAITEACKEAIWLKGLLNELNEDLQISFRLSIDTGFSLLDFLLSILFLGVAFPFLVTTEYDLAKLHLIDEEEEAFHEDVRATDQIYSLCLVGHCLTNSVVHFPSLRNTLADLWIQTDENPLIVPLNMTDFWVQIHDLHPGLMTISMAEQFKNFFDQFLDYDTSFSSIGFQSVMRIRVRLEVSKPLKQKKKILIVKDRVIYARFQYEKLSLFCFNCGKLGHGESFCPLRTNALLMFRLALQVRTAEPNENPLLECPWFGKGVIWFRFKVILIFMWMLTFMIMNLVKLRYLRVFMGTPMNVFGGGLGSCYGNLEMIKLHLGL
ncbi:hypothetical protein CXB51_021839 [Gossypium anomalum]|uniref:Retrovirus-related Pol polyprotein from transposon TNT 1-94 n=1 Tax=Gossypium anomalum TaxID=47600 RepID=A0A8J5YJF4_9ROSI|nr:hypothetical protein CXB51_021839 [Gossypium anomalum]